MTMLATPLEAELPLYFGAGGELFGLYQSAGTPASKAVLLCPPLGQEQIRCHRLYRQLAHALAAEGIPVLRFDYYGCGDSAGASAQVDWQRCLVDARDAVDEIECVSDVDGPGERVERAGQLDASAGCRGALACGQQRTRALTPSAVVEDKERVTGLGEVFGLLRLAHLDHHRRGPPMTAHDDREAAVTGEVVGRVELSGHRDTPHSRC